MNIARPLVLVATFLALFISACSQPEDFTAPMLEPQFGTRGYDYVESLAYNKLGHLYVVGRLDASGSLGGDPFLRRYNSAGSLLWETYLDMTAAIDGSSVTAGVVTDGYGNAYVSWSYDVQDVGRQSNLAKYNSSGKLMWKNSLPATGIINLALDSSANLYVVSGPNATSHLTKYTTSGAQVWQRSVANPAWYLATSLNSVYIMRLDGYLEKYTLSGSKVWTKLLALDGTRPRSLRLGANDELFVLGEIFLGTENVDGCSADEYQYVLYKLNSSGTRQWKKLVTAQPTNRCVGLSTDSYGNAYVTGSLTNNVTSDADAFVAKYSRWGSRRWSRAFGTAAQDFGRSVATYDGSEIFVGGWTYGTLTHRNLGGSDAFLRKMDKNGNRIWTR
jgi:hypothetical protein